MTSRKRRLCIVNPFEHGGGAEQQIALLIEALIRADHFDIYYLTRHVHEPMPHRSYRVVPVGDGGRVPAFGYITDFAPLYGALRRIGPEVIYQRVACGYTGICALYARRHRARLIWHVAHDTDVTPATLDVGRNVLRRRLEKWSVEYGLRHADRIVVQTQHQRELLRRYYGRTGALIVPNFHPEALEDLKKSPTPTVIWIANFKTWKRPEVFVRLASALRDLQQVQFLMLGEMPSGPKDRQWRENLLQSMAQIPNLEYLGHRTQEEVNQILARAWIFVNTSIHEGYPNTFIQSWIRDVVVVSLEVNPDGVLDAEGVGIHAGSEEGLADAVRRLVADPAARMRYAERARRYARATHSLRNAELLVDLIESESAGVAP